MKQKLSVTVDAETVRQVEQAVAQGSFRNKSHAMEHALVQLLRQILEEEAMKEENEKKE